MLKYWEVFNRFLMKRFKVLQMFMPTHHPLLHNWKCIGLFCSLYIYMLCAGYINDIISKSVIVIREWVFAICLGSIVDPSIGLCHIFLTLVLCHRSSKRPRNTTQGAPLEGHRTETELGVEHNKEKSLRSEKRDLMIEWFKRKDRR